MDEQEKAFIQLAFVEQRLYTDIASILGITKKDLTRLTFKWRNEQKRIASLRNLYRRKNFSGLTFPQFYAWYTGHERACCYCGITETQIAELLNREKIRTKRITTRGRSLELERVAPNESYGNLPNLRLSCYWCNNAKSDEFSEEEFREIAKGIARVWQKRLEP